MLPPQPQDRRKVAAALRCRGRHAAARGSERCALLGAASTVTPTRTGSRTTVEGCADSAACQGAKPGCGDPLQGVGKRDCGTMQGLPCGWLTTLDRDGPTGLAASLVPRGGARAGSAEERAAERREQARPGAPAKAVRVKAGPSPLISCRRGGGRRGQ